MMDFIQTGTVEGTGAEIIVELGFVPRVVKVYNIDGDCVLHWNDQMGANRGYKINASIQELIATGGITVVEGDQNTIPGFRIGTDADLNVSGETLAWEAYRAY